MVRFVNNRYVTEYLFVSVQTAEGGKERASRNADGRLAESNLTLQELMTVGDPNVLSADAQHSALSDLARIANQLDSSGRKSAGMAAADAAHASVVGRHKATSLSEDHIPPQRPSVIQKKTHSRYNCKNLHKLT